MKVCDLNNGFELHANNIGHPYLSYPHPTGMRPAGFTISVVSFSDPENVALVEKWQADPNHDSLRARGDPRWQAACAFCQLRK